MAAYRGCEPSPPRHRIRTTTEVPVCLVTIQIGWYEDASAEGVYLYVQHVQLYVKTTNDYTGLIKPEPETDEEEGKG